MPDEVAGTFDSKTHPPLRIASEVELHGPAAAAVVNGSMGLVGIWRTVGNMTAMVAMVGLLFLMYRDFVQTMRDHNAAVESSLERGMKQQAEETRSVGQKLDNVASELRQIRTLTRKD